MNRLAGNLLSRTIWLIHQNNILLHTLLAADYVKQYSLDE